MALGGVSGILPLWNPLEAILEKQVAIEVRHLGGKEYLVNGEQSYKTNNGTFRSLCRTLIREGYNEEEMVILYAYSGTQAFKEKPLIYWAEGLLSEGDEGFRLRKYPKDQWKTPRAEGLK